MMKVKNNEIKLIIFDLDGTLLDSCKIWQEVDINFFNKRNLLMPSTYSQDISHMGLTAASIYTKETFNLKESPEEIIKEWEDAVLEKYKNEVKLKPYAREFLEQCKRNGIILTIATANQENCYLPCLKRNEVLSYFQKIIDVRNYPQGKDNPDIYLQISKEFNLDPKNILVIEDISKAINSANKGGFNTCAIFEETSLEEENKKQASDIYILSFKDLLEIANEK